MGAILSTYVIINLYDLDYESEFYDSEEAVNNAEDEALSRCQDLPPPNSTTQAPSAPLPPPSSHPDATDHPDYSVATVTGLMAGSETPVLIVDSFPSGSAGAPIADGSPNCMGPGSAQELPRHNIWAPFRSQQDWEIARWAKRHGTTSSAVTELLAIPEVCIPDESCFRSAFYKSYKVVEKLGLSYGNAKELNGINSLDAQHSSKRPSLFAMKVSNCIIERSYRAFGVSLGFLHLHTNSYSSRSVTTWTQAVPVGFLMRCIQGTGGGRYRYGHEQIHILAGC